MQDFKVVRCNETHAYDFQIFCLANKDHFGDYIDFGRQAPYWDLVDFKKWLKGWSLEPLPNENIFIYDQERIVGFGRIAGDGKFPPQILYFVHSDYQNRGLGLAIANKLLEQAFQVRKYSYVYLHIDSSNTKSLKIAHKIGAIHMRDSQTPRKARLETGIMKIFRLENPDPSVPKIDLYESKPELKRSEVLGVVIRSPYSYLS